MKNKTSLFVAALYSFVVCVFGCSCNSKDVTPNPGSGNGGGTTTTDTQAPSVPSGLAAVATTNSVTLSWNASSDNIGVVGYKILRTGVQTGTSVSLGYTDANLTPNTLYSYTVTAYDAAGNTSAQSSAVSMTTSTVATLATVTTTAPNSIANTTAISGGNITNNGGSVITARGVCWNTSGNPSIADTKTMDGTEVNPFVSSITGLTLGTKYYLRAYATNSVGTAYGSEVTFTTTGYYLGQRTGGGIVVDVWSNGDHCTIMDSVYLAPQYAYGCQSSLIGGTSADANAGMTNTDKIVAGCGSEGAAKLCKQSTHGGFSNWYLGSKDKWLKVYQNRALINFTFTIAGTWTSTEDDATFAWAQHMWNGTQARNAKMTGPTVPAGPSVMAFRDL